MPHYNVEPRYTPGSPAQVDERTAFRVADEERQGYEVTLAGAHGTIAKQEAELVGLGGIVEYRTERPGVWVVLDVITGERFLRPIDKHGETPRNREARLQRLAASYRLPIQQLEALTGGGRDPDL